jgi:hypothetical protein
MRLLRTAVGRPRRALRVALLPFGMVAALACGASDRPPPSEDYVTKSPAPDGSGPPPINLNGPPHAPMCNLGPEGGVCACVDQPLLVDPPNIYFLLDRSGSMAQLNKWPNVQTVLEKLVIALGPRASVGAAVFPDPNQDQCAPGVEVFSPTRGDAPAGTAGPTAASLTTVLHRIPAAGGTPTATTLASLLPRLMSLPGKTFAILATDGGPNCNAGARCNLNHCTSNIDSMSNCKPEPNCCDPQYANGPELCLDTQPTVDAVAAIAAAKIPVYVVGVPGSAPYAQVLDQLAQAGGTARAGEPQYYAIDTADTAALLQVLSGIAAKITGTCTLDLGSTPPDPDLVNVFFDERALPQMGPDGWMLDGNTVTVLGASCQKILNGSVLDVRVVAGCPTVTL